MSTKVTDLPPGYEVVKQEYGMPCDHPACAILHRRLAREPFADGAWHDEDWWNPANNTEGRVRTNRWHEVQRVEWVILLNGARVGDAHSTKREAVAEARTQPTI